jgi:hypothetical protein
VQSERLQKLLRNGELVRKNKWKGCDKTERCWKMREKRGK